MYSRPTLRPVVAAGALVGILTLSSAPPGVAQSAEPDVYGDWMARDPNDWPQIALINQIEYTDSVHRDAACAFLLDTGDEIVAATAKHVIRFFKSRTMDTVSFEGTLKNWRMFPKNSPEDIVVIDRLINEDPNESLERIERPGDWLLLTVRRATDAVQPLRLRSPLA